MERKTEKQRCEFPPPNPSILLGLKKQPLCFSCFRYSSKCSQRKEREKERERYGLVKRNTAIETDPDIDTHKNRGRTLMMTSEEDDPL